MEISISAFESFLYSVDRIPSTTPNRWAAVASMVQKMCEETSESSSVSLRVGRYGSSGESRVKFGASVKECCELYTLIQSELFVPWRIPHGVLCGGDSASLYSRVILVPPIEQCCGARLQIDPRFSSPMVHTCNGTHLGAMFHGQCKSCKTRYYYSFSELFNGDGEVTRTYYRVRNEKQYFQNSSVTVFEKKLLIDITNNIVCSAATFESRSEVYEGNVKMASSRQSTDHSVTSDCIPTRRRIEDGWFMWAIVDTYNKLEMLEKTNLYATYTETGKRRDVESLCKPLWEKICSLRNKWVMHKCKVKGCAEGYVTVDGNEKLRRPMCAAPRSRIQTCRDLPTICTCNVVLTVLFCEYCVCLIWL